MSNKLVDGIMITIVIVAVLGLLHIAEVINYQPEGTCKYFIVTEPPQ